MDCLLAGTRVSLFVMEFNASKLSSAASNLLSAHLWKTFRSKPNAIPVDTKTVRLPTGTAFAFRPECCSDSQRNGVRLQTGIAFAIDRIPHQSQSSKGSCGIRIFALP